MRRNSWIGLLYCTLAFVAGGCRLAAADQITSCTHLQFCYCVDSDLLPTIEEHVATIRKALSTERAAGKAIGYISIPISSLEGSYYKVNLDTAADVVVRLNERFGAGSVWTLNPGLDVWALPKGTTGAEYMLMWTRVLEGAAGTGADFDFVYFTGPSDFSRKLGLTGKDDMAALDAEYDRRLVTDPGIQNIDKKQFRNYYALRASVAFSLGSHDEWNIVRAINEKRRTIDKASGIAKQLGIFFDGYPAPPGLYEAPVALGNVGRCLVR
jgi:hypothetical protein